MSNIIKYYLNKYNLKLNMYLVLSKNLAIKYDYIVTLLLFIN